MFKFKQNRRNKTCCLFLFFSFICLFFMGNSCTTGEYVPPEEYVPDKEVVYLIQKTEFGPIKYTPVLEEPYSWETNPVIDKENPDFINITSFESVLIPDLHADAKLFLEVKEHLQFMKYDENYRDLKAQLDNYVFVKPAPRKMTKGKLIKTYSNGNEYEYPEIKGASIVYFKDGEYKINLPDGFTYYHKTKGNYFENDPDGNEIYAVFPEDNNFRIQKNDITYTHWPKQKEIKTTHGTVSYFEEGDDPEQYQYYPDPKSEIKLYTFFIDNYSSGPSSIAFFNEHGLRFDYYPTSDKISVQYGDEEVTIIYNEYRKIHSHFNQKEHKREGLISKYFPEGIRFLDLDKSLSYSQVNPHWPENYQKTKIGPFTFLHTKKDKDFLSKISEEKLNTVYRMAKEITGLTCASWRTIILPPDLQSYRKLHAGNEPEKLSWYPSGFQGKDIIVMWPPSVPRYTLPEGDQYFWNEEFFDILIHELVHLMVGESTGLVHQVPVWLNEGLAVYVESRYSGFTRYYWDITFEVAFKKDKLHRWDDITTHSTSYFMVAAARIHYAQSYKMTAFLIEKYGIKKVVEYLQSFKTEDRDSAFSLNTVYKENFKKILGIPWEENEADFSAYIKKEIKNRKKKDKV